MGESTKNGMLVRKVDNSTNRPGVVWHLLSTGGLSPSSLPRLYTATYCGLLAIALLLAMDTWLWCRNNRRTKNM